jgi:uncharacterized protein YdaU (DUF1376 family)
VSIVHIAFYPSDWLAGTRGMSDAETGVYITLIAKMYEMAGPIERDDQRLYRLCGCKSKASFLKSLEYLLSEGKIIEQDGGLFNERVQKEIKNTTEKSAKAKAAAVSRWNKKSNKNNEGTDANASPEHMPQQCQPEPEPELYIKDTNVSLSISPANDLSEAVSIYNHAAAVSGWPQVQKTTPNRSKQIRARLAECDGVEGWRIAVEKAQASDFLCGRTAKPWTGFGFDWLIKAGNFTKLMEGNYDNRDCNPTHAGHNAFGGAGRPGNGTAQAFAAVAARMSGQA